MKAEILSTGEEVLNGITVDSNAARIAAHLDDIGLTVVRHQCVGDDKAALIQIIGEIAARADLCVVTGGLGPTSDDLTPAAAAAAVQRELVFCQEALDGIVAFMNARGHQGELNPSNRRQAYLPSGSEPLANPVGTASGFVLQIRNCRFYFLPGVPHEMRRMLAEQVVPRIRKDFDLTPHWKRVFNTFGWTESALNEHLADFETRFADIHLGFRVSFPTIEVYVKAPASGDSAARRRFEQAGTWVLARVGHRAISALGRSMQAEVGELLRAAGATLAVAESCTGGLIAHLLTSVAGSSDYFVLSAVTYANSAKTAVLGVTEKTIERYGAVSIETADAMAAGVRKAAGTTYGLSVSGIAGPGGGSADKPVGTVCIGLATPEGSRARRFAFASGGRDRHIRIFAFTALDIMRRQLQYPDRDVFLQERGK